mgnify:CR=1 FL=1
MTQERIDTSKYEGHTEGPWWTGEWFTDGYSTFEKGYCVEQRIVTEPPFVDEVGEWICLVDNEADAKLIADAPEILAELKRCYKELDELPTRRELMDIFDYQKWLEYVESYFLADGSFNQDPDFVRKCAVNNKYGYRIEVIDGVETVVHESEY